MSVAHHVIQVDGKPVGFAMNLDARFVFYTVHPALRHLDDERFDNLETLRSVVANAVSRSEAARKASA